jgi:hypothetical protein
MTNGPSTPWHKMELGWESAKYLRESHTAYARLLDGEHIFVILPDGQFPSEGNGGYYSLAAAFKAKGLI